MYIIISRFYVDGRNQGAGGSLAEERRSDSFTTTSECSEFGDEASFPKRPKVCILSFRFVLIQS